MPFDIKSIALYALGLLVVALTAMFLYASSAATVAQSRQQTAEANLKTERSEHGRTRDALASQKREAETLLRSLNASVLARQNQLDALHDQQAQASVAHGKVVADLRRDLLALRTSRRLQLAAEAGGRGGGGAAEAGTGRPAAPGGGQDPAQAGWVLPAATAGARDFDAEADDDAFDADGINVAYIACRADAVGLRAALAAP